MSQRGQQRRESDDVVEGSFSSSIDSTDEKKSTTSTAVKITYMMSSEMLQWIEGEKQTRQVCESENLDSTTHSHVQGSLLIGDGLHDADGERKEERNEQGEKQSPRRHVAVKKREETRQQTRERNAGSNPRYSRFPSTNDSKCHSEVNEEHCCVPPEGDFLILPHQSRVDVVLVVEPSPGLRPDRSAVVKSGVNEGSHEAGETHGVAHLRRKKEEGRVSRARGKEDEEGRTVKVIGTKISE